MRSIRRHLTYSNIVSGFVLCTALTATAAAATLYTGLNVVDGSLTTSDVKNGSITRADIATTAYNSMRGRTGPTGDNGATGPVGPVGDTGPQGDMGDKSYSLVRYASYAAPFLQANPAVPANPNALGWDSTSYTTPSWSGAANPNFKTSGYALNTSPMQITSNEPVLLQLTGNNQTTTGTMQATGAGLLSATATINVSHHANGESSSNFTGGLPVHGRMRCTLRYANNGAAITAGSPKLGESEWISTGRNHRVSTITMTGSAKITSNIAANYNVGISCADFNYTGATQWRFVGGNIVAHAIYIAP